MSSPSQIPELTRDLVNTGGQVSCQKEMLREQDFFSGDHLMIFLRKKLKLSKISVLLGILILVHSQATFWGMTRCSSR